MDPSNAHALVQAVGEQVSRTFRVQGLGREARRLVVSHSRPLWTRIERGTTHGTTNHLARSRPRAQSKEIVPSDPAGIHGIPQD